jgi:hypothetical protein
MTDKDAMKLALEALELLTGAWQTFDALDYGDKAITALKEALAQPEQEPVAWVDPTTLHHVKIGLEGVHLVYETEMVNSLPLYEKPQGWRDNVAQAYLKGFDEGERRYRWLRKEYAESRETYLAECVPSENALDEYIDRQMAKTSIKTERWSGK